MNFLLGDLSLRKNENKSLPINRKTSPTICPIPFMSIYGTAKGGIVACCESQETLLSKEGESFSETWNNENYKELRRALMNGEKPELCRKCWKNEDEGFRSNREQALDDLEEKFYGRLKLRSLKDGAVENYPVFLELKASNICNLKCRMCHPESSHRIYEDREIIDKYRKGLPWSSKPLRSTELVKQLKQLGKHFEKNISVLQFSGGEPLISQEQFDLTSYLADRYGKNINLRYSTNLNNLRFEKYDVLKLWKKFRSVSVKISADGVEDVYDYIRVGGDFELLKENLDKLTRSKLRNVELGLGFTTQAYNVFQLPEVLDFYSRYMELDRITTHMLYTPRLMCINNFPPEIRKKIMNKLELSSWDFSDKINFLDQVQDDQEREKRWEKLQQYTQEMENKYQVKEGFNFLMEKYLSAY
jgi:MoaA/NifB/PqqE/SkfB family radical SAM enzyme